MESVKQQKTLKNSCFVLMWIFWLVLLKNVSWQILHIFFLITFVFRVIFDMISRVIVYNNRHIKKLQLKRKKLGKLEHGWFFSNFDFLINRWAETVCLTHESQVEFTLLQVYAFNIPIEVTFTRESIFTFIACDIFLKNHYVLFCNAL